MFGYVIHRILLAIPTLFVITFLSFAISRLAPGDPAELKVGMGQGQQFQSAGKGRDLTDEMVKLYHKKWNLDKPLFYFTILEKFNDESPKNLLQRLTFRWNGAISQYHIWTADILRLDFGNSIFTGQPVIEKIKETMPVTITLNLISTFLAYLIAIPLGIYSAIRPHSIWDRVSTVIVFILYSLPNFWIGMLLIIFFGGGDFFHWFPNSGLVSNNHETLSSFEKVLDYAWHLILPITIYTYGSFAYLSRQMRVGMLEVIQQDYIRTARAKGLEEKTVVLKHALRNSLIPIITILAYLLPAMIGGSVIVETIFSINGMGSLSFHAITARDYPIIMAVFTISAILTLIGMLIADILYVLVDPRITFEKR